MNNITIDSPQFQVWFAEVQKRSAAYMKARFAILPVPKFTTNDGKRYIRVFRDNSAYAFIDKTNGDVLMPASWRAPAKHPRGNVWNEDHGLNCTGPYGIAYLNGSGMTAWES